MVDDGQLMIQWTLEDQTCIAISTQSFLFPSFLSSTLRSVSHITDDAKHVHRLVQINSIQTISFRGNYGWKIGTFCCHHPRTIDEAEIRGHYKMLPISY